MSSFTNKAHRETPNIALYERRRHLLGLGKPVIYISMLAVGLKPLILKSVDFKNLHVTLLLV